jgi:hypothetical protein
VNPKVSIVIPCLNEADSLGTCIDQAWIGLRQLPEIGEVIVADNGSSDSSREVAARHGATVVDASLRGYGAALMAGIAAARGEWIIMADADASYDFGELPRFVAELRAGAELVMGCRLPAGGGKVTPGAMPVLHRWVGNPLFTTIARIWFRAPIHDALCGMRGFTKPLYQRLELRCTGMEYAAEMVIKAALQRAAFAEVAITLHPDKRAAHPPHLRTFRDGWRTLRFYLLLSPRWLFGVPGVALVLLGAIAATVALPGLSIGRVGFGPHTLLFAGFFVLLGVQMMLLGVVAKAYAVGRGLLPDSALLRRAVRWLELEYGLLCGLCVGACGALMLLMAFLKWRSVDFGALDYVATMRVAIPGVTLAAVGVQIVLASFLLGIFALPHRSSDPAIPE